MHIMVDAITPTTVGTSLEHVSSVVVPGDRSGTPNISSTGAPATTTYATDGTGSSRTNQDLAAADYY